MSKVLMIAPTPFFADRGCHTQIYEEIKSLQKLGHDIVLCTYGLGRDVPGINIVRCMNFFWYKKLSAGPSLTKIMLLPVLTWKVLRMIRKFKPEIIHAHLHEGAFIARFCRIFYRKPHYIFDMQGSLSGEILQHKFVSPDSLSYRFFVRMEKMINSWFPVITQSDSMVAELKKINGDSADVTNVKDGVDTDIFSPMPEDKVLAEELKIDLNKKRILFMGLLEEYQGVDLMFQAFAKVAEKFPEVQFIIIGYPNIEKYTAMCENLNIKKNTFFLGKIDYLALPKYLSLASIAIAPKIALTEGDGKIYNYMAMGMATIAFDRSVSREILGDAGMFCSLGDINALADKICYALNSPKEWTEKGRLARKRAIDLLSWDAVGRRIDEVYQRLK